MSILASAAKIISFTKWVLGIVKAAQEAGKDASELIDIALDVLKKPNLDDSDIDAQRARIDALRAELHVPLPPPEEGEEE